MYSQFSTQIILLLAVALIYAAFDVFNKRNVPDIFAYAGVVLGIIVTLIYNSGFLYLSFGLAALIAMVGYLIYRAGLWGAGDYFELLTLSLLLPVQPQPIYSNLPQFGLPFIASVFVATGFVAIWIVPIYYLLFTKKTRIRVVTDINHIVYGVSLLAIYLMMLIFMNSIYGFDTGRFLLLVLIAVPSAVTLIFESEITSRMVRLIYPRKLEEGDIIAFNMMDDAQKRYFEKKYRNFGRLATKQLIVKLRASKKKLPVYKNAAPLAFFMLVGVVISLLFGNIMMFML